MMHTEKKFANDCNLKESCISQMHVMGAEKHSRVLLFAPIVNDNYGRLGKIIRAGIVWALRTILAVIAACAACVAIMSLIIGLWMTTFQALAGVGAFSAMIRMTWRR